MRIVCARIAAALAIAALSPCLAEGDSLLLLVQKTGEEHKLVILDPTGKSPPVELGKLPGDPLRNEIELSASPDGRRIAAGALHKLMVWTAPSWTLKEFHTDYYRAVPVWKDASTIWIWAIESGQSTGHLYEIDARTGKEISSRPRPEDCALRLLLYDMAPCASGALLLGTDAKNKWKLILWDGKGFDTLQSLGTACDQIVLSPDGMHVALRPADKNGFLAGPLRNGSLERIPCDHNIYGLAWTGGSKQIIVCGSNKVSAKVSVYDLATKTFKEIGGLAGYQLLSDGPTSYLLQDGQFLPFQLGPDLGKKPLIRLPSGFNVHASLLPRWNLPRDPAIEAKARGLLQALPASDWQKQEETLKTLVDLGLPALCAIQEEASKPSSLSDALGQAAKTILEEFSQPVLVAPPPSWVLDQIGRLGDADHAVRSRSEEALRKRLRFPGVERILKERQEASDPETTRAIRSLLDAVEWESLKAGPLAGGVPGVPDWEERARDKDPKAVLALLKTLKQVARSVPLVEHLAKNRTQPEVRREAIETLAHLKSKGSLPFLWKTACDRQEDAQLRAHAVQAVGRIGDLSYGDRLADLARSAAEEDADIRHFALEALAVLKGKAWPSECGTWLKDRTIPPEIRAAALHGLKSACSNEGGYCGFPKEMRQVLARALKHEEAGIREASMELLAQAANDLSQQIAIGRDGMDLQEPLLEKIRSWEQAPESPQFQLLLAEALLWVAPEEVVPFLAEWMQWTGDKPSDLQQLLLDRLVNAVRAYDPDNQGSGGATDTVVQLRKKQYKSLRTLVPVLVPYLGDATPFQRLTDGKEHWEFQVRDAALDGLIRLTGQSFRMYLGLFNDDGGIWGFKSDAARKGAIGTFLKWWETNKDGYASEKK